jgi:hypothetical protein
MESERVKRILDFVSRSVRSGGVLGTPGWKSAAGSLVKE